MNFKIDINSIINKLLFVGIMATIGYFVDFQYAKGEIKKNTEGIKETKQEVKGISNHVTLMATMMCEKEIEQNPGKAPKRCVELLAQFKNTTN